MTVTVAQLGARALRKLGIAIVADAARPGEGATVTSSAVAARVILELGIPVAEGDRPAAPGAALGAFVLGTDTLNEQPIVSQSELAARALRAVGINPAQLGAGTATGTVYTADALAVEVLIKLAVIAPEEVPSTQDRSEAIARVYAVHDILAGADYITWTANTIPGNVSDFYIIMASQLAAPTFGKPADREAFTSAQAMIRIQALSGTYGQSLAEDKIQEVQEAVNAQGLVSWDLTAVPVALAEAYVRMAATLLAPVMGYQQDPQSRGVEKADWDAGIAAFHRAAVVKGAQERAQDKVKAVAGELNDLGLVSWTAETIPASMADPLASMAAMQMGSEFGKEFDPKAYAVEMDRVRRVSMGGAAGQALAEQKIRAVQWSLEARGRARWTLFDIPSWCEELIVLKAAVLLAPEVGAKADPAWDMQAEQDMMRIVSLPSNLAPVVATYF